MTLKLACGKSRMVSCLRPAIEMWISAMRNSTVRISETDAMWCNVAVMNYTEMEAKVREATNNEPWGASSTQLQEIANATHS